MSGARDQLSRIFYRSVAFIYPRMRRVYHFSRDRRPADLARAAQSLAQILKVNQPPVSAPELPALLVTRLSQVACPWLAETVARKVLRARHRVPVNRKLVLLEWDDPPAELAERALTWLARRADTVVLLWGPPGGDPRPPAAGRATVHPDLGTRLSLGGVDLAICTTGGTFADWLRRGVPTVFLAADPRPLRGTPIWEAHARRAALLVTHPSYLEDALAMALTREVSATLRAQLRRWWARGPAGDPACG